MLVLSRKPGEKILIGDSVTVTIVRIGPNTVRIGIEAPRDMNIENNTGGTDNITLLAFAERWPLAAWTNLMRVLLNLHETITRY